jgi:hypothetical protein
MGKLNSQLVKPHPDVGDQRRELTCATLHRLLGFVQRLLRALRGFPGVAVQVVEIEAANFETSFSSLDRLKG